MYSVQKEPGWPLWPLFATMPVVLALGFVTGMAFATYRSAVAPPAEKVASATGSPTPSSNTALPSGDSSWMIPASPGSIPGPVAGTASPPRVSPASPPSTPPQTVNPSPVSVYFRGPAGTIGEAQAALRTDFGLYRVGSETIAIDYETMRQATGGVSLIGLISVHDYETWARALQSDPDKLKSWLEKAATRVLPASKAEGFHIGWAVVDVVRMRPDGFSPGEVTALDNRSFLVIRPLAATDDHAKTSVSLRSAAEMTQPALTHYSPWATYGPVINFDSTDLYRPTRAMNAQPLNR